MKVKTSFDSILMLIHMQMAKEKQNLLLDTSEKKMDKARFECYLLVLTCPKSSGSQSPFSSIILYNILQNMFITLFPEFADNTSILILPLLLFLFEPI